MDLTRLAVDVTSDASVAGPDHHWVLDLPEEPVVVTGDEHRLHQVLANLLSNAGTHTPRGTTVTVRVTPAAAAGGLAGLSVHDDGPGIPAEVREHIWERARQHDVPDQPPRGRRAGRGRPLGFCGSEGGDHDV